MLKRKKLSKKESNLFYECVDNEKIKVLKSVYSKISDNIVEVRKEVEDDIFGFDRWKDWRLKICNFSCIWELCCEIEDWNRINSEFDGEYESIMFRECYEDYINYINVIKDEEFKKEVINCFNWYFSEWIDDDNN
jgi:hypothetical protein